VRTRELHIDNGFVFEHRFRFYVFTALALVGVVISGQLLALAIPLVGVVGITAKQGTQVNTKSGRYRKYRSAFGVRTGAWQEIDESEVLLLLPMNTRTHFGSHAGQQSYTEQKRWVLYIASANHRNKQDIGRSTSKATLLEAVEELETKTNFRLESYLPQVTAKTRRRNKR